MQLERARGRHPDEAVDSVRAVLRIIIVFALTTPFWSLFDQKASTWVLQGKTMVVPHDQWWWPSFLVKEAGQMQALNPLLVMLIIPFNNIVLYPGAAAHGLGADRAAAHGLGHRVLRLRLDRRGPDPAAHRQRRVRHRWHGRCCRTCC